MKLYYALVSTTHVARHPDALGVAISRHHSYEAALKAWHEFDNSLARIVTVKRWHGLGENIFPDHVWGA